MRTRFIITSIIIQLVDSKSYARNNIGKSIDNNINEKWKKVDKKLISIVEHI
jgi:hypothetical protein